MEIDLVFVIRVGYRPSLFPAVISWDALLRAHCGREGGSPQLLFTSSRPARSAMTLFRGVRVSLFLWQTCFDEHRFVLLILLINSPRSLFGWEKKRSKEKMIE